MLTTAFILLATVALSFTYPWIKEGKSPPRLLLMFALVALIGAIVAAGVPTKDLIEMLPL